MKNNNIFRNSIDNILIITLLLCSSLFTSCLNLLSDGQDTPERENSSYVILEGTINPQNIENNSRYAYPTITEIPNGSSYYYKAIVTDGTNTATGEGSFSSWADAKYSLKVPYGTWTNIIVEIYKESTCINKIYEGTKTINLVVNETSPATVGEEVIVKPQHITGLSGNINLTIYNNTNITTLYAKLIYTGSEFTSPAAISITNNSSASFVINNVPTGSYNVTINFYKQSDCSDIPCYSCFESINVYPDLTTDLWGGNNDTAPHLQAQEDGSVHFVLTQNLLDKFVRTTFYVGTSTDGTGNGSYFNPFSNLTDAISLCTSDSDIYRIILTDDIQITEDITITKNITISSLGEDNKKTISGGSTLRTFSLSTKPITFNNLILNNILIKVMYKTSINNCTINNGTNYSIQVYTGYLLLSGECSFSGNIYSNNLTINLTGNVYPPDTDADGIVATILTDKTTVSDIFSGGNTSQNINSIHYFNILPTSYTTNTPARQFIDFSNSSNLNNYELFVVRYVADTNSTTNGLGIAGADGGKGTKLKPYNDVFNAADSFDNDLDTDYNEQTANAIDNYKYLIYIAGTVGVNNGDPNRDLVFGSSGITASYYLRGYDSTKTNMIKRLNGVNHITNRNLFTITGSKIDVHVDNLTFDDSFSNDSIPTSSLGNCFYIQSGADTSNKNSLELNNVTIKKHKVSGEGYAIKAGENTILKLNNVNISSCQGNPGGAIYYAGSDNIEIKGIITINNNKCVESSTSQKNSNIYIVDQNVKLQLTNSLNSNSRIGISNLKPTKSNPKIVFTDGFSSHIPPGTAPTTIFSSDEDYIICQDNNEVAVAGVTYGSIKPKTKDNVVLFANGTSFITGQANTVEIVPKINGIKIDNEKLSNWKFELYFYNNKLNIETTSSTTLPYQDNNKLTFPVGTLPTGLSVYAQVDYDGSSYCTEIKFTDNNILNLTSAPASGQTVAITNNDGWNKLTEWAINDNISFDGVKLVLDSDITLVDTKTIMYYNSNGSIDYNTHFKGSIDGQGHVITINSLNNDFNGALIYNFNNASGAIENIIIEGDITTSQEYTGIVYTLREGQIKNCINRCNVTSTSTQYYLAGIIGYAYGSSPEIIDCINEGNLTGMASIGGIVAKSNVGSLKVIRCKNTGNITCLGYSSKYAGGIVGEGFSLFVDCMNSGNITGKYYAGGIAGYFDMRKEPNLADTEYKRGIYNSYNTGNINITEASGYCGGIAGRIGDEDYNGNPTDQNYAFIENCYNSGIVTSDNNNNIGGFIGKVIHDCEQSYIKNNFYLKTDAQTYYGYAGTTSDDPTKVNSFTSFGDIVNSLNTWVNNVPTSASYTFSNWTVTYKNGTPQLDLNIFIKE